MAEVEELPISAYLTGDALKYIDLEPDCRPPNESPRERGATTNKGRCLRVLEAVAAGRARICVLPEFGRSNVLFLYEAG